MYRRIIYSIMLSLSACMCLAIVIYVPKIFTRITCLVSALAAILLTFFYVFFNVIVEEDKIKIRNHFGKNFTISLSQITKVKCYYVNRQLFMLTYNINIFADGKKVKISSDMINFDKVALYLIENYDNGVINIGAIDKTCRIELEKYSKIQTAKSKDK